ncbi:MAG: phosphoglucosamine mutase [Candidatus Bathyarchaeota archaeon]|nr:phosphoglucosamine mutase [Candidatus Bathyarchaeota archaeon]
MKPRLFGSSGIRGLANIDITTTLAQRVGAALATLHHGGTIVVGRDARVTGPMLETALNSGLASGGADTLSVGLVPTPVTAWMIRETGSDAGVEITASHNPPQYNGLKVFNAMGMSLTIEQQLKVEEVLEKEAYNLAEWDGVGTVEEVDAIEPYVERLGETLNELGNHNVGLDLFCGATCTVASVAYEELGIEAEIINGVPDGMFPAGNPEPDRNSLARLGAFMKSRGLTIGFGYDGDGDRMMPVGEDGEMVSPDRVLAAYAGYAVERNQGGVVVTHVGASMNVDDMVRQAGGKVIRTPVGDAFITEAMAEHNAVFGGEPVGAWVMPEVHMCPDGVLASLKLLEALEHKEMTLKEFVEQAPEYPLDRAKLECSNELKPKAMKAIAENYQDAYKDVSSVSTVDGVRLEMNNGWVLIRPSGTEPIIRVTVEGKTSEDVESLMEKGKSLVRDTLVRVK